jgi:hypothetical protein
MKRNFADFAISRVTKILCPSHYVVQHEYIDKYILRCHTRYSSVPTQSIVIVLIAVTTPALVGICLGATLFLVTVAAVTCFCYRRHSMLSQCGKKGIRGGPEKPLALQQHRRPTAVKSPAGSSGTTYLKKSPSPTGSVRSPPGVRLGLPSQLRPMRFCVCHCFLCPFLADTNF